MKKIIQRENLKKDKYEKKMKHLEINQNKKIKIQKISKKNNKN